ncbi:MAG: insulinase family protein, partial [Treponema sp.]|nr:insulinase family protein [Treponema sp.]
MQYFKKHKPVKPALFLVLALSLAGALSCAGAPPPLERSLDAALYDGLGLPGDPQPFMEEARAGALPSGLRYYILENAMPEGRAQLFLAVHAGSVLETDDERGLAHFVEHMAFNGTEGFPKFELVEYLRSLGMRWGPEVNAYTSYDRTVYGIEVPVEFDPGGLKVIPDKALAVLDDWTRAVSFNAGCSQMAADVYFLDFFKLFVRFGSADGFSERLSEVSDFSKQRLSWGLNEEEE